MKQHPFLAATVGAALTVFVVIVSAFDRKIYFEPNEDAFDF